jgi:hypothetical protein
MEGYTPLQEEWYHFANEMDSLMEKVPGNVTRIKDCTLKEEWRHSCGWNFEDSEEDHDMWRDSYDILEPGYSPDYLKQLMGYADRCGLTSFVRAVKYPLIEAYFKSEVK